MSETSRWAVGVARAGTLLIDVCAFWLSATTLTDLARRAGIDAMQAWMWPVIVDGMIVVATVGVVALARHGSRATVYPWCLLVAGAAVSVTANCSHALVAGAELPGVLAACVAAVPPLVLLASTHLTVQLGRRRGAAPDAGEGSPKMPGVVRAEPDEATSVGARPVAEPRAVSALGRSPRPADVVPSASGRSSSREEAVARVRAAEWAREGLSNREIASRVGVHPSTVGRWLKSVSAHGQITEAGREPAGEVPAS